MNHNSGLHCCKALGASIPPISSQHDRVVSQLKVSLKPRLQLHEISRLCRFFDSVPPCLLMVGVGGELGKSCAYFHNTHVSSHARTQLTRDHLLRLLRKVIDFDAVIIQQALEAIDEVGDLLKVKYSRRKIEAKE